METLCSSLFDCLSPSVMIYMLKDVLVINTVNHKNIKMGSMKHWFMFLYFVVHSFRFSSSQPVDESLFERKDSVIR